MINSSQPAIAKDLVLIGGGHSHVEVLKNFAMKPMPGVRLTLIARDVQTPYSGMLPGYVAGHYSFDEAHIDLRPLCQFASARLYHDRVVGIDTVNKLVICANRPAVAYDLLSVNIGSRPQIHQLPGASEFATAVKPINRFVDRWHRLLERVLAQRGPHRIGIVGEGAAGVEILLAIQFRLTSELNRHKPGHSLPEFHLISRSARIMPAFAPGVARRFERILGERGVQVHRGAEAVQIYADGLELSSGTKIKLDEVLLVTGAGAPAWLRESGLGVDDGGFITAHDTLQSTSHKDIFGAGDIVHVIKHPRPKAGVFAVRQGRPLADNLRRALLDRPLRPFVPQKTLLALVSTGDKYAIASKASLHFEGARLWAWKDWIDRRWMSKYTRLPELSMDKPAPLDHRLTNEEELRQISSLALRCAGCGSKVASSVLSRVISELKQTPGHNILIGLHEADDAAVVEVPQGKLMVHTVDHFRAFIDDPYLFGQIAANHALSDIFAMGAEAQSALAIATVPFGIEVKVEDTLRQLMAGAILVLDDANANLVGGHTSEGAELALGFAVNGIVDREKVLRKTGMQEGDILVLTKPLGTGTLFAADMRRKTRGRWIEAALASMLLSNRVAAEHLFAYGATACTDITGFGLLGHLLEMMRSCSVEVEIDLRTLPLIEGAFETAQMGILSSLHPANLRLRASISNLQDAQSSAIYPLMFDPQTSGGLLASLPADKVDGCVQALHQSGYPEAAIIGRVKASENRLEPVTLLI